jgi:hypothetical protein
MLIPQVKSRFQPCPGIWVQNLRIPERLAWGRSAEIDLTQVQFSLHVSDDLIQRSFHPAGLGYQPQQINSGESLPDWLNNLAVGERRPVLACNALHTNFVRGNGFVIADGQLVCKTPGTIPLDGDHYQPLDGRFTALTLSTSSGQVRKLEIQQGVVLDYPSCDVAISGPPIVYQGRNTAGEIPVRFPTNGQTLGDEINFSPDEVTARTSFTTLGVNRAGRLLAVSVFAGTPRRMPGQGDRVVFQPSVSDGLTLSEMADLMIHLGAVEAILGGGSGDTQQVIQGCPAWCALPRPQESRSSLNSPLRGLGAILAIYGGLTPKLLDWLNSSL